MNTPSHPTRVKAMLNARIKKLVAAGPLVAASLVTIEKKCGKSGCRCIQGEKHVGHYLTYKENAKTKTVYVPQELLPEVQTWVDEHHRLKALIAQISQLSIATIRNHVTTRRRKAGRP